MEFLSQYGLFAAEVITMVVAILITVAGLIAIASKDKQSKGKLKIRHMNEKYDDMADALEQETLTKKQYKAAKKQRKAEQKTKDAAKKAEQKQHKKDLANQQTPSQEQSQNKSQDQSPEKPTSTKQSGKIFVLHFKGDIQASHIENLRNEITALLTVVTPKDEVLVCLESGGGMVHSYGLAASQLQRIKDKNIPLTVSVDRVAASGGYLMACVADKIIAAPFAIIGSIGVIAQIPNFHKLLKKNNIDFEQLTAGEYKRTLTMFGENSKKARAKMQQDLEDIHILFKDFISEHRPIVNLAEAATGEHWLAKRAKDLRLVDDLQTSDDYMLAASKEREIYAVEYNIKESMLKKMTHAVKMMLNMRDLSIHSGNNALNRIKTQHDIANNYTLQNFTSTNLANNSDSIFYAKSLDDSVV